MRAVALMLAGALLLVGTVACRPDPSPRRAGTGERSGLEAAAPGFGGATRDYGTVPEFSLLRSDGTHFRRGDLAGKIWIADFIFTRCAGACPIMTAKMASLQSALGPESGVLFVSLTVDPEHDSPQVLQRYAAEAGADRKRWFFLTGEGADVRELARKGFKLGADLDPQTSEQIGGSGLTHSQKLVLVDGLFRIRGYYDGTDAEAVGRLERDARALAAGMS